MTSGVVRSIGAEPPGGVAGGGEVGVVVAKGGGAA
jgi:hypothetical protein